jgi:hypothetical protein
VAPPSGGANRTGGRVIRAVPIFRRATGTAARPVQWHRRVQSALRYYAAASTPCVAAHSTVRALYGAYSGKLYQVRRSDNTTKDILTLTAGGVADSAPQDTFCSGSTCVTTVLYDQSGKGNDMWYQGSPWSPPQRVSAPVRATTESLNVGGHKVLTLSTPAIATGTTVPSRACQPVPNPRGCTW